MFDAIRPWLLVGYLAALILTVRVLARVLR
jgi:lipid-A-disaccharide synthase-like uncharacterized protein